MKNCVLSSSEFHVGVARMFFFAAACAFTAASTFAAPPASLDSSPAAIGFAAKADPWVRDELNAKATADALVVVELPPDLSAAARIPDRVERIRYVVDTLKRVADSTQAPLKEWLDERGIAYRSFWIANMVQVRADAQTFRELAARADVTRIVANPEVRVPISPLIDSLEQNRKATAAVEWGVAKINAHQLWALGFTGVGIVIAGQDTGYAWQHAALRNKYRGWNGAEADHNYNWHDAITTGNGGPCGLASVVPCDDNGHGTHTMGTMVGDDGGNNQIGVAPGAKWIGCRNMDLGAGTRATYVDCFQWFLAPTNLAGLNPDVAKAPHIINNSWGCPTFEAGCETPASSDPIRIAIEALNSAGILVVASAGNDGTLGCSSVNDPPAVYAASFSVGATDAGDNLAGFSSRGPVGFDGSNRAKPEVSAPGVSVRSSVPSGGYGALSGTSMAGPHVAGAAALLMQAYPSLRSNPEEVRRLLMRSAKRMPSSQNCGNLATTVPNNSAGWGRIDVHAAYLQGAGTTLNVDDSSGATRYLAGTDGVLLMRFLLNVTGEALTVGAVSSGALRTSHTDVLAWLNARRPAFDIDGDTAVTPAVDGVLVLRYLLGFRGASLIDGVLGASSQRASAADVEAYIALLVP
jgi:subtilisin family serine protease